MCKLFAITEIENAGNAERFANLAIPYITKTDNHGLGIMRLGENGVHIRRWLEPPLAGQKQSKLLMRYQAALKHQYNETGTKSQRLYALAIHGRYATCERTLVNTHPFAKDGTALMHNGIINNADKFERTLSTCDSEVLLTQYLKHNVCGAVSESGTLGAALTAALEGIAGYYASIVFNADGTVDIWRDDRATLYLADVRGVGAVISTTADIIVKTAKKARAYVRGIDEILPYTVLRWYKGTNTVIDTFEGIKPVPVAPTITTNTIEPHIKSVSEVSPESPWYYSDDLKDYGAERDTEWDRVKQAWSKKGGAPLNVGL